jgi:adenine phosphoribosyltransferase
LNQGGDTIATEEEKITLLRQSITDAPLIWKGDYPYFIHPLTDGVPRQEAELLAAARDLVMRRVDWDEIDIILGIEAMGLPLAVALSLASGKPLVVGRKRSYGLPGEYAIDQSTGYSKGEIFLNDIKVGDRVLLVDDVVSTGGTLEPILRAISAMGAIVADCWVIFDKDDGMQRLRDLFNCPLNSLLKIAIIEGKTVVMD